MYELLPGSMIMTMRKAPSAWPLVMMFGTLAAGEPTQHDDKGPDDDKDDDDSLLSAAAVQVLSIQAIWVLQQYQGLDCNQEADVHEHGELALMAFKFRRRKAAVLQSFVQSQGLLQRLAGPL